MTKNKSSVTKNSESNSCGRCPARRIEHRVAARTSPMSRRSIDFLQSELVQNIQQAGTGFNNTVTS